MERIVIEVNKGTAKKWRASTRKKKRQLATVLQKALRDTETSQVSDPLPGYARPSEEILQTHIKKLQIELPEYQQFLNRIRKSATEKGLTQEILVELLRKDG